MEVVLPTGEVVKIGSCAVSPSWFGRAPLPDIAGMFIGWQAGTGIVTKIALQLWPKMKHVEGIQLFSYEPGATFRYMRKMARTRIVDDHMILTMDTTKVLMTKTTGPFERAPGEPEFLSIVNIAANTENELRAKAEIRDELMKEEFKDSKVDVMPGEPQAGPIRATIDSLGGCTWVGTYAPTSKWEETVPKLYPIFDKYGFPRIVFLRPFREGHFGQWRPIVAFNKGDAEEVERVRKWVHDVTVLALDLGYIPYKAPYQSIKMMEERGDPNFVELVRRVKKMLDPNNIMNPGRWGAPEE